MRIGMNMSGVAYFVSSPFLNYAKTMDHPRTSNNQYIGPAFHDALGWPTTLSGLEGDGTLVCYIYMPTQAELGNVATEFRVSWTGDGTLNQTRCGTEVGGSRTANEFRFIKSSDQGNPAITITAINPANPPKNFKVVRVSQEALIASGEIFQPEYLAFHGKTTGPMRFMDALNTNNSAQTDISWYGQLNSYTWMGAGKNETPLICRGVPIEICCALANKLQRDAYFCWSVRFGAADCTAFANLVRLHLDPDLIFWAECGNEIWNSIFPAMGILQPDATARYGATNPFGYPPFLQHGYVAARGMQAMKAVYADRPTKFKAVHASQTANVDIGNQFAYGANDFTGGQYGTLFDAVATTSYYAHTMDSEAGMVLTHNWAQQADRAAAFLETYKVFKTGRNNANTLILDDPLDAQAQLYDNWIAWTAANGIEEVIHYEANWHVTFNYNTPRSDPRMDAVLEYMTAFHNSAHKTQLTTDLLNLSASKGVTEFIFFADVGAGSYFGWFGAQDSFIGAASPTVQALDDYAETFAGVVPKIVTATVTLTDQSNNAVVSRQYSFPITA